VPRWNGLPLTKEQRREAQRQATQRWREKQRELNPEKFERHARSSSELFMSHVRIDNPNPNSCWIWIGARRGVGIDKETGERRQAQYGNFVKDGKSMLAHRAAYELFISPIPDGMLVLHRCDNPLCVKPAHLWLGTQADNMRDAIRKGRLDRKALAAGFERDAEGRFAQTNP